MWIQIQLAPAVKVWGISGSSHIIATEYALNVTGLDFVSIETW